MNVSLAEACSASGLHPRLVGEIVREYGQELGVSESEEGDLHLPEDSVPLLKSIHLWQAEGLGVEEIRQRLKAPGRPPVEFQDNELYNRLLDLVTRLEKTEKQRAEDRDRLLTALIRTQQEVQQLRYQLVGMTTRADRKRKRFLGIF
ncbi:MAG: hypothetical protein AB1497_03800 [Bacillota bacterium]